MWLLMIPVSLVTWALQLCVDVLLWVLGWPLCLFLALTNQYERRYVPLFARTLLVWKPRWARPWGNDEDGIDGAGTIDPHNTFAQKSANWPLWFRILMWSAWRNPSGNVRFIRPFGFRIEPWHVNWVGNSADPGAQAKSDPDAFLWSYTWHGVYSGLWIEWKSHHVRIGWAILPRDSIGISPLDYRSKGCGFKLQFQRS